MLKVQPQIKDFDERTLQNLKIDILLTEIEKLISGKQLEKSGKFKDGIIFLSSLSFHICSEKSYVFVSIMDSYL